MQWLTMTVKKDFSLVRTSNAWIFRFYFCKVVMETRN